METEPEMKQMDELQRLIRDMPYEKLKENIYICVANTCILLTSFLETSGNQGWSQRLIDSKGEPILSKEEQEKLESAFASAPWLLSILTEKEETEKEETEKEGEEEETPQEGGAEQLQIDFDLDEMFENFLEQTEKADKYWGQYYQDPTSKISRLMSGDIQPTPNPLIRIPKKPLVAFLFFLIDMFRLGAARSGSTSTFLTLLVLVKELALGDWRQAIVTGTGFFSPSGLAMSVIGKYIVNAWTMINPDIRDEILRSMFKGSKSLLVGFLLWAGTTFTPFFVQEKIEVAFQKLRDIIQKASLEDEFTTLKEETNKQLEPYGKYVLFKGLGTERVSKISIYDIQNLQALLRWNLISCSKEGNDILNSLQSEPIFRLLLQLMNVPITAKDKMQACGSVGNYPSLLDMISEGLEPEILPKLVEEKVSKEDLEEELKEKEKRIQELEAQVGREKITEGQQEEETKEQQEAQQEGQQEEETKEQQEGQQEKQKGGRKRKTRSNNRKTNTKGKKQTRKRNK